MLCLWLAHTCCCLVTYMWHVRNVIIWQFMAMSLFTACSFCTNLSMKGKAILRKVWRYFFYNLEVKMEGDERTYYECDHNSHQDKDSHTEVPHPSTSRVWPQGLHSQGNRSNHWKSWGEVEGRRERERERESKIIVKTTTMITLTIITYLQ